MQASLRPSTRDQARGCRTQSEGTGAGAAHVCRLFSRQNAQRAYKAASALLVQALKVPVFHAAQQLERIPLAQHGVLHAGAPEASDGHGDNCAGRHSGLCDEVCRRGLLTRRFALCAMALLHSEQPRELSAVRMCTRSKRR